MPLFLSHSLFKNDKKKANNDRKLSERNFLVFCSNPPSIQYEIREIYNKFRNSKNSYIITDCN